MDTISISTGGGQARSRHAATRNRKPVIALVLAGGKPHPGFGPDAPAFRPLLPVLGRPAIAHVLEALHASCVARTLVFHDAGCDLVSAGLAHEGTTFHALPFPTPPIGASVLHALKAVVRECGIRHVRRCRILLLPCDLPFATAAAIDRLVLRADAREFDFAYVVVSRAALAATLPGKRFRAYRAADLGGQYAPQMSMFIAGAFLGTTRDGRGVTIGDWTEAEVDHLFRTIDLLRDRRSTIWLVPRFVHDLGGRRATRASDWWLIARALARALVGRLRSTDFDRVAARLFRMRTVCIDSESPELSADFDTPADAEYYRELTRGAGTPR